MIVLFLLLTNFVSAFETIPLTSSFISPSLYSQKKPRSREDAVEMMQAFYIKKVLTEPIFTKLEIFEDEDIDFIDSAQSQMINEMIAEQMAQKLAEQDLLKFKKRFLPQYNKKYIKTNNTLPNYKRNIN